MRSTKLGTIVTLLASLLILSCGEGHSKSSKTPAATKPPSGAGGAGPGMGMGGAAAGATGTAGSTGAPVDAGTAGAAGATSGAGVGDPGSGGAGGDPGSGGAGAGGDPGSGGAGAGGDPGSAGAGDPGAAGAGGGTASFSAACRSDSDCMPGLLCLIHGRRGHCTLECTNDSQCPPTSPGCTRRGVCKLP
jgi:hypothetical protein